MDERYDQKRCTREFDGLPLVWKETRRSRRTLDTDCDQAEPQMVRDRRARCGRGRQGLFCSFVQPIWPAREGLVTDLGHFGFKGS